MSKETYMATFSLFDYYDEDNVFEIHTKTSYSYSPGMPESGRFGPPENYDPGSGDEVEFDEKDIQFFNAADMTPIEVPSWLRMVIFNKILSDHREKMIEEANEA